MDHFLKINRQQQKTLIRLYVAVATLLLLLIAIYALWMRPKPPHLPSPPSREVVSTTPTPSPTPSPRGKIAIVIDDIGYSTPLAERYFAISNRVTLAIIPNAPFAAALAKRAHQLGFKLLIHLPMQPQAIEKGEPGALSAEMSDAQIIDAITNAYSQVPYAIGINNHQGSRYTADRAAMQRLMTLLTPYHPLILDSRTTASSQLARAAKEAGLATLSRDLFLDDVRQESQILVQLEALRQLAMKQGKAIGIGHPYAETSSALAEFLKRHPEAALALTPLSEFIHN